MADWRRSAFKPFQDDGEQPAGNPRLFAPSRSGARLTRILLSTVARPVCSPFTGEDGVFRRKHSGFGRVQTASACEQLIQLRELFGQAFRRTGEGFVEGRFCGV
jgi:hypothetical protein